MAHSGTTRSMLRTLVTWCASINLSLLSTFLRRANISLVVPLILTSISPSELSVIGCTTPRPHFLRRFSHFSCSFLSGCVIWVLFCKQVNVFIRLRKILILVHLVIQHERAEVWVGAIIVRIANAKLVWVRGSFPAAFFPRIHDFDDLLLRNLARVVCALDCDEARVELQTLLGQLLLRDPRPVRLQPIVTANFGFFGLLCLSVLLTLCLLHFLDHEVVRQNPYAVLFH